MEKEVESVCVIDSVKNISDGMPCTPCTNLIQRDLNGFMDLSDVYSF